jgi:serine/threonine protein kinase
MAAVPVPVNEEGWPITIGGYELLSSIGKGAFAEVHRARCRSKGQDVALKVVNKQAFRKGANLGALKELQALQELQHPNVLGLHAVFIHADKVHLVLTLCHCDLTALIKERSVTLSEAHVKCIVMQLLDALVFCHRRGLMHRDIKPDNILLTREGALKLSDFGHATREREPGVAAYHEVVTLWYRSPELLFQSPEHGPPVDMWSVGCVLAELLLRQPLFPGLETDMSQLAHIFRLLGSPIDSQPEPVSLPVAPAAAVTASGTGTVPMLDDGIDGADTGDAYSDISLGRVTESVGVSVAGDCLVAARRRARGYRFKLQVPVDQQVALAQELLLPPCQAAGSSPPALQLLPQAHEPSWPGCTHLPGYCEFEQRKAQPWRTIFAAATTPLSESALDLLQGLLVYDPARRLTAAAARAHPWFTAAPAPCQPSDLPLPSLAPRFKP